jgi:hypothetical protein
MPGIGGRAGSFAAAQRAMPEIRGPVAAGEREIVVAAAIEGRGGVEVREISIRLRKLPLRPDAIAATKGTMSGIAPCGAEMRPMAPPMPGIATGVAALLVAWSVDEGAGR